MKKFLIALLVICSLVTTVSAHSGKTDSNGGHKDNKNKSGLGSYHYHCGGYPAHLHTSGYCPYRDTFPSSVKVSAEKTDIGMGEKITLTATVSPSNACTTNVDWESSDPSVVSIKNGVATAVGYGTATISASTFNDKVGSIKITVKEITAENVTIANAPASLFVGETSKLECTITPANVDNPTIVWSSGNTEIADVSSEGEVTAKSEGTTTISATASNGVSASFELNVQILDVEAVSITAERPTVGVGEKMLLTAAVSPENATFQEVTWKSADETLLTVSENGEVTALGCGVVTVTATSANGISNTIEIEITETPTEQEKVENNENQTDESIEETSDGSSAFLGFLVVAGIAALIIFLKRRS